MFKDILDLDHFERNMFFSDPISRFTFFRGVHCLTCTPSAFTSECCRTHTIMAAMHRLTPLPALLVDNGVHPSAARRVCGASGGMHVRRAGYQFNVTFLRKFLAPIFEVHEIRQAGPHELLLKWSWTMNFWWGARC